MMKLYYKLNKYCKITTMFSQYVMSEILDISIIYFGTKYKININ